MPTKSGQYVYLDDGSSAIQTYAANAADANSMTPTEIQSRYAQTIQTHNAVSVATAGFSTSSWIDTDGADFVGITVKSGATNFMVNLFWSADQTNGGRQNGVINETTNADASTLVQTRARYLQITLNNTNAAAQTMSAWAYLKA